MSRNKKTDNYDFSGGESSERRVPDEAEHAEKRGRGRLYGWFVKLWHGFKDIFCRFWNPLWKQLNKFVSVPFLIMLFLSFSLWYAIKLGYTYQTEMPFDVVVDGHEFRVNGVVEGQGGRLFARKLYGHNDIILDWSDLDVSSSNVNQGAVVISPYSLQNAISAQSSEIKVLSVGPIPEIVL